MAQLVKNPPAMQAACCTGDQGLIPGLGRSTGEGNGNPLQYSCLENPIGLQRPQETMDTLAMRKKGDMVSADGL